MPLLRIFAGCGALTCLGASVVAQAADEPLTFTPSTQWVLDYADDSCALRRGFDAGGQEAILELRQFAPGSTLQLVVAGDDAQLTGAPLRFRFEPDSTTAELPDPIKVSYGEARKGVMFWGTLAPVAMGGAGGEPGWSDEQRDAREKSITALVVTGKIQPGIRLEIGGMNQAMNGMRACLDELLEHWGIDVEAQRTLTRRARPLDMSEWASEIQAEYPGHMLRQGYGGLINMRVIVGPDGTPTSCRAQIEISDPVFEKAACKKTLQHARFEPALDAGGNAVASYFTTRIIYRISR